MKVDESLAVVGLATAVIGLLAGALQVAAAVPATGWSAGVRRFLSAVVALVLLATSGICFILVRARLDTPVPPHGEILTFKDGDPVRDYPVLDFSYRVDHIAEGFTPWIVIVDPRAPNPYHPRQRECDPSGDRQVCDRLYIGADPATGPVPAQDEDFQLLLIAVDTTARDAIRAYSTTASSHGWPGLRLLPGRYTVLDTVKVRRMYTR